MGGSISYGADNDAMINTLIKLQYVRTDVVERVLRSVDRSFYFLPEFKHTAYRDLAWKQGNLHLSAPCIYSEVLEHLKLESGQSFLNIGSGTGYLSTLAGLILGPYGTNHGIEIHADVVEYAYEKLEQFKRTCCGVDVFEFCEPVFVVGNALNLNSDRRYDRIYCGAACPEAHQEHVKKFMKVGGILVLPCEDDLLKIVRTSEETWEKSSVLPVSFSVLQFPDKNSSSMVTIPDPEPLRLQDICRTSIRSLLRSIIEKEETELTQKRKNKPKKSCAKKIYGSENYFFMPVFEDSAATDAGVHQNEIFVRNSLFDNFPPVTFERLIRNLARNYQNVNNDEYEVGRISTTPAIDRRADERESNNAILQRHSRVLRARDADVLLSRNHSRQIAVKLKTHRDDSDDDVDRDESSGSRNSGNDSDGGNSGGCNSDDTTCSVNNVSIDNGSSSDDKRCSINFNLSHDINADSDSSYDDDDDDDSNFIKTYNRSNTNNGKNEYSTVTDADDGNATSENINEDDNTCENVENHTKPNLTDTTTQQTSENTQIDSNAVSSSSRTRSIGALKMKKDHDDGDDSNFIKTYNRSNTNNGKNEYSTVPDVDDGNATSENINEDDNTCKNVENHTKPNLTDTTTQQTSENTQIDHHNAVSSSSRTRSFGALKMKKDQFTKINAYKKPCYAWKQTLDEREETTGVDLPKKVMKREKLDSGISEGSDDGKLSACSASPVVESTAITASTADEVMEIDSDEDSDFTEDTSCEENHSDVEGNDSKSIHNSISLKYRTYMERKLQLLPLPKTMKVYLNYNREFL